jgi:hypothetical protein
MTVHGRMTLAWDNAHYEPEVFTIPHARGAGYVIGSMRQGVSLTGYSC